MSGPVLNAILNNSKHVAVVLEISSDGQVTGGCVIGAGASRANLHLNVPTRRPDSTGARTVANGGLWLGTCGGLFGLRQKGPITVGAASKFELEADAGIGGNDPREIDLAFSDTPGWSIEIVADGMLKAEPTPFR
ncbi:MAG TPA: hypothetical protein GX399_12000 [Xanthomonadaceae bacterium]|nr:hypothetical protein [Xanthomonadaceae bacterium]